MITPCLMAQKKELSQARQFIKSRKNYDKAEQLMTNLLRDSANRANPRIYLVWLDAVKGQYDQANERLYLKQKQDTAAFFSLTRRMFTIAETLDSIDCLPDKRGRISPTHRQKHAAMLNGYRPNLFNGGTYHIRKSDWRQAYDYLDFYIDCGRQPLFTGYDFSSAENRMAEAAYWATYSGYRLQDAALTLRHADEALADTARADFVLQFKAEAFRWKGDDAQYVTTLQEGFRRYPLFSYFFPRLVDAYTAAEQYEHALALADSALTVCDSCELFLFAKSSTLLRLERWSESLVYSQRIILQNDSMPEAYVNAATACVSLAENLDEHREKSQRKSYFQRARTYMEYYRQLMPAEQQKWAPMLYRIYLNLNLGRQFDEIDRLLRDSGQ